MRKQLAGTQLTAAVSRTSPVPLYYQLKEIFRSWITSGMFNGSDKFPSEAELQRLFGVSRITVRRALAELVNEGYLIREQGRGTFVTRSKVQDYLRRLTSFTEDMAARGFSTHSNILEFRIVVDNQIAQKMGIDPNEQLVKLRRLRFADKEPLAIQNAYVRHRYCPGIIERGLVDDSLYKTLEREYGLSIAYALQSVGAKPADEYEAKMLKINVGFPVLVLERLTYLSNNEVIEYTVSSFRADSYVFIIQLRR